MLIILKSEEHLNTTSVLIYLLYSRLYMLGMRKCPNPSAIGPTFLFITTKFSKLIDSTSEMIAVKHYNKKTANFYDLMLLF